MLLHGGTPSAGTIIRALPAIFSHLMMIDLPVPVIALDSLFVLHLQIKHIAAAHRTIAGIQPAEQN